MAGHAIGKIFCGDHKDPCMHLVVNRAKHVHDPGLSKYHSAGLAFGIQAEIELV